MNTLIPSAENLEEQPDFARFFACEPGPELAESLRAVDQLKLVLDACRNKPELASKWDAVHTRLRHEWTYHSNALEGSTLSLGDTIFFLQYGLTVAGKPLKDFLDARNHAEAIEMLFEWLGQRHLLSEGFLKEINALLLQGVTHTPALDPFGQRVEKPAHPGQYKIRPNHVLQLDGSIHYYVEPEQVPAQMAFLVEWLREPSDMHPVIRSALAHYNLVRIHPFDDGNGRGARLLMNGLLLQAGYPPAIVKTEDRRAYILAIAQADQGHTSVFAHYISNSLRQTQQTMLEVLQA